MSLEVVKKYDQDLSSNISSSAIEDLFADALWSTLSHAPWKADFPYFPSVRFRMIHTDHKIYLQYEVQEEFVKATYVRPNENVWEDSCVEFFISFDDKKTYFNFEFNVLGTGVIGYGGIEKSTRKRLDVTEIERIDTFTQVTKLQGKKTWSILLVIPKDIFGVYIEQGKTYHANFYKCGDKLPNPHFITWNDITYPKPNFHLPAFFGEIQFSDYR